MSGLKIKKEKFKITTYKDFLLPTVQSYAVHCHAVVFSFFFFFLYYFEPTTLLLFSNNKTD